MTTTAVLGDAWAVPGGVLTVLLEARTTQSQLRITEVARIRIAGDAEIIERRPVLETLRVGEEISLARGNG